MFNVSQVLRFSVDYIHRIKVYTSSPKYSIKINGRPEGFFASQKGLRHGDPLSPYLFCTMHGGNAKIAYHPKCAGVGLMHL